MNRINMIKNHISDDELKTVSDDIFGTVFGMKNPISIDSLKNRFNSLDDRCDNELFNLIDGPVSHGVDKLESYIEYKMMEYQGYNYLYLSSLIQKYGTDGDYSNIILPSIIDIPDKKFKSGSDLLYNNKESYVGQIILLSHPEDCENIAKRHIQKQPNFTPLLMDSIISSTNNDHWRKQRDHYTHVFLPNASLKKIITTTQERAIYAIHNLKDNIKDNSEINICEFLLHEANAQLNLSMFGSNKMYTEDNNRLIRRAMKGNAHSGELKNYIDNLTDVLENSNDLNNTSETNSEKVHGPLGRAISDHNVDTITKYGNSLIFSFAGHDTTGHSMTFFCLEMAKNSKYQDTICNEIDNYFKNNSIVTYEGLENFPFLSRCWTEILRLWPAIPNGTFRQLQYDDYITGKDGEDVKLKKGTYVQITNWSRHRSKELWGDDVDIFNPYRDFNYREIWGNNYKGYNPHSERFSPFTYPPRDCIGKNFAHMEARIILIYLFKNFKFKLPDGLNSYDWNDYRCINKGTLSPVNLVTGEMGLNLIITKRN